jgi:hypothetical protein
MFIRNKEALKRELPNITRSCQGLLDNSKNGIDINYKKHTTKRSNLQNAFYFINCKSIADFLNDAGCVFKVQGMDLFYTSDIIHEINKKRFEINTTTKLTVGEFCEYMEKMFAFWQERTRYEWIPLESTMSYIERTGLIINK